MQTLEQPHADEFVDTRTGNKVEVLEKDQDSECICQGNWRTIVKETEHLIGKRFRDSDGKEYTFFGLVHGNDDYYYGMRGSSYMRLLSCVGDIKTFDFELIEPEEEQDA